MWLHQTRGCLLTGWEGGTDRERDRGSNQSSTQSPWHWRNVTRVHNIIPPTPQEHYLNSNLYQRLNVSRRTPITAYTHTSLYVQTVLIERKWIGMTHFTLSYLYEIGMPNIHFSEKSFLCWWHFANRKEEDVQIILICCWLMCWCERYSLVAGN